MAVGAAEQEARMQHEIVSQEEWLEARKALFAKEKALTHARDELVRERRALPWVKVEKPYRFDGPFGKLSLADLFDGRSQLLLQHFMLGPGWEAGCTGCSFMADHVDAARQHFEHADLSFVAVSRAPLPEIQRYRERMGWQFPWVSSFGSDFNYDFGVSFTKEQLAAGKVFYNYGMTEGYDELQGVSVFYKDEAGDVFHTYSTYSRGAESFLGTFMFLDLVPKGRNETSTMDWVRRHDEYETDGRTQPLVAAAAPACCHGEKAA
jgi:predicted dithiol-disulfide oxidoreductase (DUF899 family)